MNSHLPLCRSLTINKINLANHLITDMNLKSTTVLIELLYIKDNTWFAHYYEIDEYGKKVLKQNYINGNNINELKSQFGVSLLAT